MEYDFMEEILEQISQRHKEHIHLLQEDTWEKLLIRVDLQDLEEVEVMEVEITLQDEIVVVILPDEELHQDVIDMTLIMMTEIDTETENMNEIDTMMIVEEIHIIDLTVTQQKLYLTK